MNSAIIRNLAALSAGELASKGLGFLATLYLARMLAVGDFGILGFVWAVYAYFALPANVGLNVIGEREVARASIPLQQLSSGIFSLRLFFSVASFLLLLLFTFGLDWDEGFRLILLAQGLSLLLIPFQVQYVVRGSDDMGLLAASQVCQSVFFLLAVWMTVGGSDDLVFVPLALLLGTIVGMGPILVRYRKRGGSFKLSFPSVSLREILRPGLIIGASGLMIQIYYNLDFVMLGFLQGLEAVGLYTAAYKIVMLLLLIPGIILSSYFPSLAKTGPDRMTLSSYLSTMCLVGAPIGFAGLFFAPWLIEFLYGAVYVGASVPLQILLFNVSVVFLAMAFANPLLAWGKHRAYFWIVATGAGTNLLLNFLLIPPYGLVGAALATLVSEGVVALRAKQVLDRTVRFPSARLVIVPLSSACVSWFLTVLFAQSTEMVFPWPLLLFTAIYGLLVLGAKRWSKWGVKGSLEGRQVIRFGMEIGSPRVLSDS